MIGRIVEVAESGRHLSRERGFVIISDRGGELGRIPLDSVGALIINAHGTTLTAAVLCAFAEQGTPVIICGNNHNPTAIVHPTDFHYEQSRRADAQLTASRPTRKRLWAEIVRAKVLVQEATIKAINGVPKPLESLRKRVRSGDPENLEAQAARYYWPQLLGPDFRRDRYAGGCNALLNYGYAVLRACSARAVLAAGLNAGIGIFHRSGQNPMRLVDDLMEPFRSFVDYGVWSLVRAGHDQLDAETKSFLAGLMWIDLHSADGTTPLSTHIQRLATSLAQLLLGERASLDFPKPPSRIEFAAFGFSKP